MLEYINKTFKYISIGKIIKWFVHSDGYMFNNLVILDETIFKWFEKNNVMLNQSDWIKLFKNYVRISSQNNKIISNNKLYEINEKIILYWFHFFIKKILAFNNDININIVSKLINWNKLYLHCKSKGLKSKILKKYFINCENLIDYANLNESDKDYYDNLQLVVKRKEYINYHHLKFINSKNIE